jgi:CRISPR/Cas system-associated exonuclease Cas4 (RecB family)
VRRLSLPDGLYISISQLKCWLRCPRQYALKYIRGVEAAFLPTAFAFGSAFHEALAAHYLELKNTGELLRRELALDVFRDAWERARSGPVPLQAEEDEGEELSALTDKGVAMLDVFLEFAEDAAAHQVVEAVEHPFAVSIFDPDTGEVLEEQLVGTVDAIIKENGRRILLEHKTAAKKYSADQLRFDHQPTAYRYAARMMKLGDVTVRYQVTTKTKAPAVQIEDVLRCEQDEDDLLRTALGVLRSIDAGADYPIRGWQCRSCPFAHACKGSSKRCGS